MTLPIDPRDDEARIPQQAGPTPPPPAADAATTASPRRSRRWLWVAAAVVVLLAVAGGAVYAFQPSDEDEAADRCRTAITGKLRSPSTAKFGEQTVTSSDGDFGSYYEVFGTVDAQNGFGAMIRGAYHCRVTLEKDGRWLVTESSVAQG